MKNSRLGLFTLTLFSLCLLVEQGTAQIGVNKTGASPHSSAVLDVSSNDSGMLLPRMEQAERLTLPLSVANVGMVVYQTNSVGADTEGMYEVVQQGVGQAWRKLDGLETYRASIIMGTSPIIASGSLPAATLSNIETGAVRIDIPGLGTNAIVLANPEFQAVGTPPVPPADYCAIAFSGNCAPRYHTLDIWVAQPAGAITSGSNPIVADIFLQHCPTAASCEVGSIDYQFHPIASTSSACLGTDAYNGNITVPGFFTWTDLPGMAAGSQFDFYCTGNESNSNSMALSVFIDWNQDGDFFDVVDGISEVVISTADRVWQNLGQPINESLAPGVGNTWTLDIPPNSVSGETTMRVVSSNLADNTLPCISSSFGSARDYVFNITGGLTPTYPGETRNCNVFAQDANGFQVRCYETANGSPVDDRFYLLINPQ